MIIMTPTSEHLDGIDCVRLDCYTLNLNDSEVMVVDGEYEVGIARDRYQAEAIAFPLVYIDDS